MKKLCTCHLCRRGFRESIKLVFKRSPYWLTLGEIRELGSLDWLPLRLYFATIGEMRRMGLLIECTRPQCGQRLFLLSSLAFPSRMPAKAKAKGGEV